MLSERKSVREKAEIKRKKHGKLLRKLVLFGVILFSTAIFAGGGLNRLETADSVTTDDTTSYVKVGELFDSDTKTFNQDNYKILLKYLTGNSNATLATVTALAETNNNQYASDGYTGTDASVMRAKTLSAGTQGSTSYSAKTAEQDVNVRLGGLDWTATYLSKDKNGNTILTLWLDENTSTSTYTKNSIETLFTNYGLTDYIVKPADSGEIDETGGPSCVDGVNVSWQSNQDSLFISSEELLNYIDGHGDTPISEGVYGNYSIYEDNENYVGSTDTGRNFGLSSYVWLPSISEIKYLWNTSSSQRENDTAYYTRTIYYEASYFFELKMDSNGDDWGEIHLSDAERPALHLNLTAIYEELYGDEEVDENGMLARVIPTISRYDGEVPAPSVLVKYEGVILTQGVDYTVTYTANVSALKGTVTVQFFGSYEGAKTLNYTFMFLDFPDGKYVAVFP